MVSFGLLELKMPTATAVSLGRAPGRSAALVDLWKPSAPRKLHSCIEFATTGGPGL